MIGSFYLKLKRNWRAWISIAELLIFNKYLIKKLEKREVENNLIISLTTIPSRLKAVELTLKSILAGEIIPKSIYMYLDEKTFEEISKRKSYIRKLVDSGHLHLRIVEDLRSYKKLIYALKEHKEKFIVICDDDVIYPKYWLAALINKYKKLSNLKSIVCHRAHEASLINDEKFLPYSLWNQEVKNVKMGSSLLFPTGTGGVLYPPNSMPSLATNSALFLKYAPTNDDIWFWFCAINNGCSFYLTDIDFDKREFLEIPNSQSISLWSTNVTNNGNDIQLENCLHFFKEQMGLNLQTILSKKELS